MSSDNFQNASDCVTLQEVIEEQDRAEEQANAVLGGSDDSNCTYEKGYVSRQALYACMDCCKPNLQAGLCLACCLECHSDHNVVELYTKRNFRCDCGNSKMSNDCKFVQQKDSVNERNQYNQNFSGTYCICRRPYPDPEAEEEEEMIQCVICEDWIHDKHCGIALPPDNKDYEDFTCAQCMQNLPVLAPYSQAWGIVEPEVDVESPELVESASASCPGAKRAASSDEAGAASAKRQRSEAELTAWNEGDPCRWEQLQKSSTVPSTAVFWPEGWREGICRCSSCKGRLFDAKLSFLLSEEDSLAVYESAGSSKSSSSIERGMQAFSQMNRVQQIELAAGYTSMKEALHEHFKRLSETQTVVTKEDVENFFAAFKQQQKSPHLQYNCK